MPTTPKSAIAAPVCRTGIAVVSLGVGSHGTLTNCRRGKPGAPW